MVLFLGIAADFDDHLSSGEYYLTESDIQIIKTRISPNTYYPVLLEHDAQVGQAHLVSSDRFLYAIGYIWTNSNLYKCISTLAEQYTAKNRDSCARQISVGMMMQILLPNLSMGFNRTDGFKLKEISLVGLGAKQNTVVTYGATPQSVIHDIRHQVPPNCITLLKTLARSRPNVYPPRDTNCSIEYLMANNLYYTQMDDRRVRLKKEFAHTQFSPIFITANKKKNMDGPFTNQEIRNVLSQIESVYKENVERDKFNKYKKHMEELERQKLAESAEDGDKNIKTLANVILTLGKKRRLNDDDDVDAPKKAKSELTSAHEAQSKWLENYMDTAKENGNKLDRLTENVAKLIECLSDKSKPENSDDKKVENDDAKIKASCLKDKSSDVVDVLAEEVCSSVPI